MSRKSKGLQFENEIAARLGIRTTARSGAHWDNADLSDENILIETKFRDAEYFAPPKADIHKIINQASKNGKDWAYITKSKLGCLVTLDINLFQEMFEVWLGDKRRTETDNE
tara:strand:+ start:76 stop:411 length:336 start_codon:yes stop_codon:yes gene_type:complete